jgi:hypothetical protein
LGDFNETQIIIFSCPSTDVPSFVEKYPKIKYAISDRPSPSDHHCIDWCGNWTFDFVKHLFHSEWIALKL